VPGGLLGGRLAGKTNTVQFPGEQLQGRPQTQKEGGWQRDEPLGQPPSGGGFAQGVEEIANHVRFAFGLPS
jgi:hypothetical protein